MDCSIIRRLSPLALAALVTACQGATSSIVPSGAGAFAPAQSAGSSPVRVAFTIEVPKAVSPRAKSAKIVVAHDGSTRPAAVIACARGVCTGTVGVPDGRDVFTVTLYDKAGAEGSPLASGSVPRTIVAGEINTVKIVLGGVAASIALDLSPPYYNYLAAGSIVIGVSAVDADGYTIAGKYSNPVTLSNSDKSSSSSLSGTMVATSAETVKLSYTANFSGSTITAKASGVADSTQTVDVNLVDDWTTFAHDDARTGWQKQPTGINAGTVSKLKNAWVVNPDKGACEKTAYHGGVNPNVADEAAPIVADGMVFFANTCGVVYALARSDGHTIWHRQLALTGGNATSGVWGTPALDTQNGRTLLLVPVWGKPGNNCPGASCIRAYGGYVAALDEATGSVVWKSTPLPEGQIRGEPLAINGVVYSGIAGGDSDSGGVQGGMMSLNETTGTQTGFFQVAPPAGSNDGGSSWSPISFDGSNIYFGTGNTVKNDGDFDGVVELNPTTMSPVTHFGSYDGDDDEDVGGGELIYGGNIYFSGKSGYYYGFPLSRFATTPLFPRVLINTYASPAGNGGIGTPTTDGNVIAVSSGYNNFTPVSSDLDVFPVGRGGRPKCKLTTAGSVIYSSAAWVKGPGDSGGIGFLGMDNGTTVATKPEFKAFDDDCNVVWTAPDISIYGFFYAGPAVVQSGVYAIDNVGNVYSWKLPATMGVDAIGHRSPAQSTNAPVRFYLAKAHHFLPPEHKTGSHAH